MTREKRASQRRVAKAPMPMREEHEKQRQRKAERYAAAFARVRLARAWVAVAAAIVTMLPACVTWFERLVRWLSSFPETRPPHRPPHRAPRLAAVLVASSLLGLVSLVAPRPVHAVPGGGGRGMPGTVSLTHDGGGTASVYTNGPGSTTFTLQNISASTVSINLVVTACSGSLAPSSCSPSPSTTTLGVGQSTTITVSYTGGASAGSGTLTLAAKNTSNVTQATASVAVTVNTAPQGPIVSVTPHRGDRRDVAQCLADCFEATLAYTTPAYVSLDVPRSITLLYRSGRARPVGRVTFDVSDTSSVVTSFRLQLTDPNGSLQRFANGSTALYFARNTAAGQPTRLVAEFDADSIPTSAKLYSAYVTSYAGSTPTVTGSLAMRVIVVNDQGSPFGAGIDVAELQRLFTSQTGGVLVTEGAGSASFFSGSCTPTTVCTFTSPNGDFSTLTTGSSQYKRTYPDGTVITFDNVGRQLSSKSRFGDSTYVTWGTTINGVSVPTTIVDPTASAFSFWWRGTGEGYGTFKDGTLGNVHTPAGVDIPLGVLPSNDMRDWVEAGGGTYRFRTTFDAQHRLTGLKLKNDST